MKPDRGGKKVPGVECGVYLYLLGIKRKKKIVVDSSREVVKEVIFS